MAHSPMHRLLIKLVDTLIGFQPRSHEVFQNLCSLYQSKEIFIVDIFFVKVLFEILINGFKQSFEFFLSISFILFLSESKCSKNTSKAKKNNSLSHPYLNTSSSLIHNKK